LLLGVGRQTRFPLIELRTHFKHFGDLADALVDLLLGHLALAHWHTDLIANALKTQLHHAPFSMGSSEIKRILPATITVRLSSLCG
jgi:hypothetical protein